MLGKVITSVFTHFNVNLLKRIPEGKGDVWKEDSSIRRDIRSK